ncbi:MAG: GNAT family N-acetyltransferase [Kiritimatiellae bacterium]|nr:GNAT family N-acetyltransferase [Kiritimatiellia bacterium]
MTSDFTIRPARLGDAEAVFALIHLNRDLLVPRSLGNIVENIDRFLVAADGADIVGCAAYQIHPELGKPEAATVEIQSVAVRAPWRRKGIGRALVDGIAERVSVFRPHEVVVLTFAPEFFSSLGFAEIPKTRVMHKLYTGCINCTKHTDPFTCPEIAMERKAPSGRGEG